jgi:hypothetical protein
VFFFLASSVKVHDHNYPNVSYRFPSLGAPANHLPSTGTHGSTIRSSRRSRLDIRHHVVHPTAHPLFDLVPYITIHRNSLYNRIRTATYADYLYDPGSSVSVFLGVCSPRDAKLHFLALGFAMQPVALECWCIQPFTSIFQSDMGKR